MERQQVGAESAQDGGYQERDVARQRQIESQLQRQGNRRVEEVIGIEDQINAEGVPDQLAVQRVGPQVQEGMLLFQRLHLN